MAQFYKLPKHEQNFKWGVLLRKLGVSSVYVVLLVILAQQFPALSEVIMGVLIPIISAIGSVILADVLGLRMQKQKLEEHLVDESDN